MRRILALSAVALAASLCLAPLARAADPAPKDAKETKTEAKPAEPEDVNKTLYALGVALSRNLATFNLTPAEVETVSKGLVDGALGKEPKDLDVNKMGPKFQELAKARAAVIADKEKKTGKEFIEKMSKEKGATKTDSGMVYIPTQEGTGTTPKATDRVKVHYHGTLQDGTVFDSSVERGQPATFPLNGVIACWTEGVQKMKVGGKAKLVCPSDLAYGDRGAPPKIKPGSTLVFDVELLGIEPPPTPRPAMSPGAAAPGAAAPPAAK
ncbi:MAG TPA: FKBP-type peptidyl-prolyl cis-trans isomerase [Candidatus Binatia bacterium]|nr:FKBP-type peptidyl-prolyl cis-trans isomerase [Candidatus Binatia bacterium]